MSQSNTLIPRRTFLQFAAAPFVLGMGLDGSADAAEPVKYGADSMSGGTVDNQIGRAHV